MDGNQTQPKKDWTEFYQFWTVVTYTREIGLGTMYPENELNPDGLDFKKSIFISINKKPDET